MRVFRPALLAAGLGAFLLPAPASAGAQAQRFPTVVTAPIRATKGAFFAVASARCPGGQHVTGGGVSTPPQTTFVMASSPEFNLDGWHGALGTINEHGFTATSILGSVQAICAPLEF